MKPTVTIPIGISASGKTTWTKQYCLNHPNTIRISRDDLRASLFGISLSEYFKQPNQREQENLITSLVWKMANQAIKEGKDIILDNTHLEIKYIKQTLNNIDGDVNFELMQFDLSLQTAILRDSQRETIIGEPVIRNQYERFKVIQSKWNEIEQLIADRDKLNFTPIIQNPKLLKAVIFDLDGTLALMNGRGPYDWDRVHKDSINEAVRL